MIQIVYSSHGLLTTVGYKLGPNKPPVYALEGSVAIAGAALRWLRDNMNLGSSYEELNQMSSRVQDSAGVYFVPAFSGLFAPHWRQDARGYVIGSLMSENHSLQIILEIKCALEHVKLKSMTSWVF